MPHRLETQSSRSLVADVRFRRLQVPPVGGHFQTAGIDRHQFLVEAAPGLAQQPLDHPFRRRISALAEVMMPDPPLSIHDIDCRPIFVRERAPYRVVAVERDRIIDPPVFTARRTFSMSFSNPNSGECTPTRPIRHPVFRSPCSDIGQRAQPIDAGVGPEIDEDDFPAQSLR